MKSKNLYNVLKNSLKCELHVEKEFRSFYSVDASSYQIKPKFVVFPKTKEDLKDLIEIAKKEKISLTPRGGGTGLVGNSLNKGIIVDMKNFKKISTDGDSVIVEPGVSKGELDQYLRKRRKFFSPNPSIGPFCQIGGMIGTNAGGSRGLKYGNIIDNIQELTFIDGNGNLITLPQNQKYSHKVLAAAKRIDIKKFPKVTKNSCGYRLDRIKRIGDTHKVLAGSEGTLGIVVSAKLKIHDVPNKRKLLVVEYESTEKAAKECVKIIKTFPAALEFVDKKTLSNINYSFSKKCSCLLFIEYDSDLVRSEKKLRKISSGRIVKKLNKETKIQKWWRFRDSALWYSLKSIKREKRVPHIIEDAVVPIKHLPKLFFIIKKLNKLYKTDSIFYGHAGNGNIHVRLIAARKNKIILKEIAQKYFHQIILMGGSITGEHGDGLARSEFVEKQYGKKNHYLFRQLKKEFDPQNILNPGKII